MYTDTFIMRRDCFPKFSDISISRKGGIFLAFIWKRLSFLCFRYSEKIRKCDISGLRKMSENPSKYCLFVYLHVSTPYVKMV